MHIKMNILITQEIQVKFLMEWKTTQIFQIILGRSAVILSLLLIF